MEMVFHRGSSARQYANVSATSRREGFGGKMYVPRAMYSLRMSFWTVPDSRSPPTPDSSATSWYSSNRTAAGALMVIDVDTLSSGISANSRRMSSMESMAT